jgi:CheY-like chemotaxis protein
LIENKESDEAKICLNKHYFYDVIFLDLEMPILKEYDICDAIKGQYK